MIRHRLPERFQGRSDTPTGTTPDVSTAVQTGTPDTDSPSETPAESESQAVESESKAGSSLGEKLKKGTTLLTLAGIGLAAIGALTRMILDRRSGDDEDPSEEESPTLDVESATVDAEEVTVETDTETVGSESGGGAGPTEESGLGSRVQATASEYPRISPLVGMLALLGMRLFVEKLGEKPAEA